MSDYLTFELQVQIIKKLPVKPLLQFRSVSKQWKSFIDSSGFIASYSISQTHLQRLLVWYEQYVCVSSVDSGKKIVSYVDDETLKPISPHKEIDPIVLGLSKQYKDLRVVGSSQGLLCLYDSNRDHSCLNSATSMVALWNPSIRKSVGIVASGVLGWMYQHTVLGFGVCPTSGDPRIVIVKNACLDMETSTSLPLEVEVFTLSTGSWRIPTTKLPEKPITITKNQVAIDKFIYWFSFHGIDIMSDGCGENKLIMSFDMTTEEFGLIDLPNSLANTTYQYFSVSKIRESLSVIEYNTINEKKVCDIWMMDQGVSNLFTRLFTIKMPYEFVRILGFKKSGGPMIETVFDHWDSAAFIFYEPCSKDLRYREPASFAFYEPCRKDFIYTAIFAKYDSFFVDSFMELETLLLLDQPDSRVYSICN